MMTKRFFAFILTLCMLFSVLPVSAAESVTARIGDISFATLAEAVSAVKDGETIEVLADPAADDIAQVSRLISFGVYYERSDVNGVTDHILADPASDVKRSVTGMSFETANSENYVFYDCTIIYDKNGGTGTPRDGAAISGKPFRLPGKFYISAPEGKEFKAWEIDGTEYPALSFYTFTANTVVTAIWQDILLTEDRTDVQTQLVSAELEKVPEALNTQYTSVSEIEAELKQALQADMPQLSAEQIAVYDVEMQFKLSNSDTWVTATESNFPAEGIAVTLPYPAGTGMDTHNFTVSHMITTGEKAGTVEVPDVTKTEDGLVVTLSGLSPVAIGWKAIAEPQTPDLWFAVLLRLYSRHFAITAAAAEGGVISDDGLSFVKYKRSQTYTITPNEGYVIADVLVDGISVGAVNSYTFKQVKTNHTIEAIFAPQK